MIGGDGSLLVARVFGTMASVPSSTRVEAIVLRTVGPQGSLFELLLPAPMRVLSGELAEIDVCWMMSGSFGRSDRSSIRPRDARRSRWRRICG